MLTFEKLDKNNKEEWNNFVDKTPNGRFEHKTDFIDFLEKNKGNLESFLIKENNKLIATISLFKENIFLFKRYSSQGIVTKENINVRKIIKELIKKTGKATYIRINKLNAKVKKTVPETFILNIKDKTIKEIFNKELESRARRAIKKAERNNLKLKISNSKEELKKFYPIYQNKMKEFKSKESSLDSLKKLMKNKNYSLFNVYSKDKVIAGGTMMIYKNMITNHLAASDKNYLEFAPNNFLYYNMIKFAKEKNLEIVNYGPSLKTDRVAKFKESMGGKPIGFEEHIILNKLPYSLFKLLSYILLKIKKII
jgi:lipid II:glycine glycyltransferase (peptidoglycan interpeptide bridge formation enzyme)